MTDEARTPRSAIFVLVDSSVVVLWLEAGEAPATEPEARHRAATRLHRFGEEFGVDLAAFEGPFPVAAPAGGAAYEWRDRDESRSGRILVWVDREGIVEISYTGERDRLFSGPRSCAGSSATPAASSAPSAGR